MTNFHHTQSTVITYIKHKDINSKNMYPCPQMTQDIIHSFMHTGPICSKPKVNVSFTVDSSSLKLLGNEWLRLDLWENEDISKNLKYNNLQHPDLCFGDPPIIYQHICIPIASIFTNSITNSQLSTDKLTRFLSFLHS